LRRNKRGKYIFCCRCAKIKTCAKLPNLGREN